MLIQFKVKKKIIQEFRNTFHLTLMVSIAISSFFFNFIALLKFVVALLMEIEKK